MGPPHSQPTAAKALGCIIYVVQQATRFELVVNQKTAKALGLVFSPMFVALADEVIE